MPDDEKINLRLEFAHVLFMDIVGYSKLLVDEQREALQELNHLVLNTDAVRAAEATGSVLRLPTGDGMALVFTSSLEAPVECALQISQALRAQPGLPLRMGIHSGPVQHVNDVNGRENIAGSGINLAQRVMDCGDAGHILVSKRVADDLAGSRRWAPYLHELGEVEVKHGLVVSLVNLYADAVGNPTPPGRSGAGTTARRRPPASTVARRPARRWLLGLGALLVALLLAFGLWRQRAAASREVASPTVPSPPPLAPAVPSVPEKSIAVLPFENLSDDKANGFFTDGVQDEILTDLAKVADLKVISRTSVMQYRDASHNLSEIGRTLGVAYVVEGSVQKAGNKVRVNAQLIDTRTDAHLWAERYDRSLDDVFAIQSEIAEAIAGQLQAKLSPREQAELAERPTADLRAYEQYVRGKDILDRFFDLKDQRTEVLQAVDLLQDATRRDPLFVGAYCSLARAHGFLYHDGFDATPARRALAREAVDNALKLRPDSGEVHLALADYYMQCDRDYARTAAELAIARPALPNSARFYLLSASLSRRRGHWEDSTREFEKALALDPQNATAKDLLGDTYVLTRRFADAERLFGPTLRTDYDPRFAVVNVAGIDFAATGDTKKWRAALRELPAYIDPSGNITVGRIFVALANGDHAAAYAALAASPLPAFQDVDFSFYYPRAWYEAQIARAAGDLTRMRTAFAACRKVLEARPETEAEEPRTLAVLAQVDAGLGNKEKALQEGRRAVELVPISQNAYDGPLVLQGLAQVYLWTGDHARAVDALETLVRVPGYLTYGYLRADPMWSPLRGDPRFEALVASLAPEHTP